jgi:hypothetical protein
MMVNNIAIDPEKLWSKDRVLTYLKENGEDDRALSDIRGEYFDCFGNELIWYFPISDGANLGADIIIVREGFLHLPYNIIDRDDREIFDLDGAALLDADAFQFCIDLWKPFSDDLLSAMTDMLRITRGA